jgi:lipopolysaccharide export system ATP-binding protein
MEDRPMSLLEVRGLVKYYGRRCVVSGVDFDVSAGEIVGLLGPNGAGKTTSFRMTTGQIAPFAGMVRFNGEEVTHLPMYQRARLGMGYLAQETSVFRKLTVEQNIIAILEIMPKSRTLGRALTRAERWDRTEKALLQFGLTKVRKNLAARLSGGEKRRLEIARCLVCEPLLVLLDEPFAAVDPLTKADIRQVVKEMAGSGIGVLVTDHDVREVLKITTRSYLIKDGKVRTHGTPAQIIRDPIAISEYLGSGFSDDSFAYDAASPRPTAPTPTLDFAPPAKPSFSGAQALLDQDKMQRLVDGLKTAQQAQAAAELIQRGFAAVPALLGALERRDVELRQVVLQILQAILKRTLAFDPFAPEAVRKQQLAALRETFERKAG